MFDSNEVGKWELSREGGHSAARVVHAGGAATGAGVALLTLAEYGLQADFGIDQLLLRKAIDAIGTSLPGRMSQATAFCFMGAIRRWQRRMGCRQKLCHSPRVA